MFYRYYNLDATGRALSVTNMMAADDVEACSFAAKIKADEGWHDIEIWEAYRQVDCGHLLPLAAEDGRLVQPRSIRPEASVII